MLNIGERASIAGRPDVAQENASCVEIHDGRLLRGVAGAGEFGLQQAKRALGGKREEEDGDCCFHSIFTEVPGSILCWPTDGRQA